jgi:hypothetical protein
MNHLSLRKANQRVPSFQGFVPWDGPQHIQYHSDLITVSKDGDADDAFGEGVVCCCGHTGAATCAHAPPSR